MDRSAERKWLFNYGSDSRGVEFSKVFFPQGGSVTPNEAKEILNTPLAIDIMKAKNYPDKPGDIYDDDVHYAFTDHIAKTALWHKKIDKSAENGTKLTTIRESLVDPVADQLIDDFKNHLKMNEGIISVGMSPETVNQIADDFGVDRRYIEKLTKINPGLDAELNKLDASAPGTSEKIRNELKVEQEKSTKQYKLLHELMSI